MRVKWYQRKENTMSTTQQPVWKLLANLGDVNPIEYGGYFVYRDETGVYEAEGEMLLEPYPDENTYDVYRFSLDRCTFINGILSDNKYHPEHAAWFAKDLSSLSEFIGGTVQELIDDFCSDNIISRATAYRAVGDYFGYDNLDSYPIRLTRNEVIQRYKDEI